MSVKCKIVTRNLEVLEISENNSSIIIFSYMKTFNYKRNLVEQEDNVSDKNQNEINSNLYKQGDKGVTVGKKPEDIDEKFHGYSGQIQGDDTLQIQQKETFKAITSIRKFSLLLYKREIVTVGRVLPKPSSVKPSHDDDDRDDDDDDGLMNQLYPHHSVVPKSFLMLSVSIVYVNVLKLMTGI